MSNANDFQTTFAFELWVSKDNFWRAHLSHLLSHLISALMSTWKSWPPQTLKAKNKVCGVWWVGGWWTDHQKYCIDQVNICAFWPRHDLDMSSTISRILERLIYPDSEHIGALHMLFYHNSIRVAQNLSATNWAYNYVCTVLQCCKNWQNWFFLIYLVIWHYLKINVTSFASFSILTRVGVWEGSKTDNVKLERSLILSYYYLSSISILFLRNKLIILTHPTAKAFRRIFTHDSRRRNGIRKISFISRIDKKSRNVFWSQTIGIQHYHFRYDFCQSSRQFRYCISFRKW